MKICSIIVGGFKNISLTKLDLEKICVIISPNNFGKSNLMEAIDFGVDFIHESRKVRKTMMGWAKGIPLCSAIENEEYHFEIEFEDEGLGEYRYVRYGFTFLWRRDDQTGQRITNEWIETRENTSVRYTSYLKRKEGKYRKGRNTNAYRKIDLDGLQLAVDVLGLMEDIEIAGVVNAIQNVLYRMCSSLDLRDRYQPLPLEYIEENEDKIKFDDKDVPKALYKLKKSAPDIYSLFEEAVYNLFPEFTEISLNEFTISNSYLENQMTVAVSNKVLSKEEMEKEIPFRIREHIYRLFVKCDYMNQPLSMANMSTGTKRVIWLLTNAFISSYSGAGIIGVEEIETSIHPKMIRNLLEILTESIGDASLIVSSHSPYLVQYLKPEKIYIGVPNKKGIASFRKIQKNKIKNIISTARNMEISVGEYLFELLSGDSDSYEILNSYLEVPIH